VIYTSGSTGVPKGVQLHHRNLMSLATACRKIQELTPNDAFAAYAGFSFVAHCYEYYPVFLAGATLHFLDDSIRLDPRAVNNYFEDNKIAVAFLPTAFGYRFVTQIENHSLRIVTLAGERFIPIEKSLSKFRIVNAYGLTECSSAITTTVIQSGEQHITVGKAIDNTEIYIVGNQNELLPIGETGELCVAGRQISNGYLGLPEKTASAFVKNPFNNSPDYVTMYHTGDVARMDENGQIEIRGRIDHQVKVRGFRVELGEIDTVALQFPNISEAVTVAAVGPDGENRLVIYVASPETIDSKSLQKNIGDELPPYMIPAQVIQLPKLPRNLSGKIDRAALPTVELSDNVDTADLPQTETEKKIITIVAKILKTPVDTIGRNMNFFDIGLDSLLLMDLILEIRQCGADLTVEQVKNNSTITALAEIVDKYNEQKMVSPDNVKDFYPLSATQHSFQNILYPLTYHQKSLLYGYLRDPESTRDNIVFKYIFSPQTDTKRLVNAICQCIAAHPLLNAQLIKDGDTYFWKRNEKSVSMNEIDEVTEYNIITDEELRQKEKTFNRPFYITSGKPLYAFKVYQTSTAVVLLYRIHHSIFDGVSQKIFINEIAAAYNNATNNNCTPNEIGDGALTAGQREQEQLVSKEIDTKCDELVKCIKKCGSAAKLQEQKQLDKPAGCAEQHIGNHFSSEQIRNFCNKYNLSPNSIFISAFAAAISRHSTNGDVLFQFIISGRDDYNLSMVGAFIKTVPIVIRYDNNLSPLENCRNAKDDITLAAQCSNVMMCKQVERGNDWGRLPDFSRAMLYIFHGNLMDESKFPVVEGQRVAYSDISVSSDDNPIPFIPLEFIVGEIDGQYKYMCKYNNALFDKKFIEQFIQEIENHINELINEVQNSND
jgi:acyl carrier protein/phenylacetate-coenzyme A ligase PaaK-like adenylate-forming protein